MNIVTTRFGQPEIVDVDERHLVALSIVGYGEGRLFARIDNEDNPALGWLQSLDDPATCFVVADPAAFFSDYAFDVTEDVVVALDLQTAEEVDVLVILRLGATPFETTANLAAPIVVNRRTGRGRQIILTAPLQSGWSVRTPLLPADSTAPAGV
ncbi:MAG: flagellar assembly protein FliW [Chloroflexota bacterium]|nr:flagellar assembly protein FliW [Dehalococcoidia bacterium]MDW8254885.1 flagellar assembly protein FliW [Chloroflexota bacterium]